MRGDVRMKSNYADIAEKLSTRIGRDKVYTDIVDRMSYSRDWSVRSASDTSLPDIVTLPASTEDVVKIVKVANEHEVPIIPCGGLTGMAGGAIVSQGGIIVDTRGMNKILEIDKENLTVTVQAGITPHKLNEELEKHGLWFPYAPESRRASTIGSAIACRSDPALGIKYGRVESFLTSAVVVTGKGEVINVGHRKTLVSSAGYPLHWLLIGSEGTLGIITEATLCVQPKPKSRCVDLVIFPSIEKTVKTLNRIIQAGLSIELVYIMDMNRFQHYTHDYFAKYGKKVELPELAEAILLISFNGDPEVVQFSRDYMKKISEENEGKLVKEREVVEAAWTSKYTLEFEAFKQAWPDSQREKRFGASDISVPQGKLNEAHKKFQELTKKYKLEPYGMAVMIGVPLRIHAAISCAVYVDDKNPEEVKRFYDYIREMAEYAVSIGGSMTSYQGDGLKFGSFSSFEHGKAFDYMKEIKIIFDPKNILNPEKKFGPRIH